MSVPGGIILIELIITSLKNLFQEGIMDMIMLIFDQFSVLMLTMACFKSPDYLCPIF